jgi:hypothetical protein
MKKLICTLWGMAVFFMVPAFGQADSVDVTYTVTDDFLNLFDSDEILEVALEFDITTFRRKRSDVEYLDAQLKYTDGGTDTVVKDLKLRARGEFRRSFCDYPPIRLNFKKSKSPDDEFSEIDKLKVVTHCKAGNEDYLLREYLVYKLYNVLTDYSYRVRLMKINYVNTNKQTKPVSAYAFVIEPDEYFAKRLGGVKVSQEKLTQKHITPESMDRMAIFNYMIGNVDWSVPGQHNVVIISQPRSQRPDLGLIVPYDFDYSGIVNTDYAVPHEALPIKSVRERFYMGVCRTEEEFRKSLAQFEDKKDAFYEVIRDFPHLKERSKKDMMTFLDGFFYMFGKRNTVVYNLLNNCKDF